MITPWRTVQRAAETFRSPGLTASALTALALALGYTVFARGGVWPADRALSLVAIAAAAAVYWAFARRPNMAPSLPPAARWLFCVLPLVFSVQILPLPARLVALLSPARAGLEEAAARVTGPARWIPLSASPAASLELLPVLFACVLVVFLVREIAWRLGRRIWVAATPLIAIGFLEGLLGVMQMRVWGGEAASHGTYVNRNHFAGLLEMCLPFAVACGLGILTRRRARLVPAACALFACAAVMLAGVICSLSRMGFVAALAGLLFMGIAGARPLRRRWKVGLLSVVLAGFVLLPTDALIGRFTELVVAPELSAATRARIWRETLPMVRDYPLFGCGLGAYESCFNRYKSVAPLATVGYAHNDYLQLLVEGGPIALAAGIAIAVFVVAEALTGARRRDSAGSSYVALAAVGALGAILLHSFVDFNLYIPANALVVAWIAGLALTPPWPDDSAPSRPAANATPSIRRASAGIPPRWRAK